MFDTYLIRIHITKHRYILTNTQNYTEIDAKIIFYIVRVRKNINNFELT